MLVNGDESEPGTCKDHVIFLHDPHAVIEGTMIAGLAIGAKMGFIYLRGEYRYLLKIVEKAVADAYAKGFLGKNIFGKEGVDFDIITQTGAGAYEVGEESALMESLEGKRGVPRIKPPFPAVVGLYGGPTVINNAETIANAPHILLMGGEAYAKLGTERNGGTRLFGISGHVERPGVYELPMGYSLRKAIYEVAGGIKDGKKLKAVVPGGSSCPVLKADEIDVGLDFDQMAKAGTMLGSGGIVVLDETVSIVEFALRTIALLPARILRLVHPLPRRHGLAQEDPHALPRRRRQEERHRQHPVPRRKHDGPHLLPARRCGGHADARLHQEVPLRVRRVPRRRAHRAPAHPDPTRRRARTRRSPLDHARRNLHRRRQEAHRTRGHAAHRRLQVRRHRDPRLLLLPRPLAAGRLPHVRRAHREGAEARHRLHHHGRRRHGRRHRDARRSRRPARPRCNCCSATTRSTAPSATPAASASCRT